MAKMHQIALGSDEKPFIFTKMRQFLSNIPSFKITDKDTILYRRYYESNNLYEQCEHLEHILTALNTPIVFCHNDLLINNILYDEKNGLLFYF